MGFRSAIKKGGGILNGDATFLGYLFTPRFKGETEDGDLMYCQVRFQEDGADVERDQHLFIGNADRYSVSEDGQELMMADGSSVTFGFSTSFGRFIDSAIDKGFPEAELPNLEVGEALSLAAMVGRRFRLKQEVDEEATRKYGPKKSKQKDPKTGQFKTYPRTNTVIDAVLGETSTKATTKKASGGDAVATRAAEVLKEVIENASTPLTRKGLALPVTKALLKEKQKNQPFADAVKAKAMDEDFQNELEWLQVDKKGTLSVAA